jgi:hypothetical protein
VKIHQIERSAESLATKLAELQPTLIVLQYVGYGFDPNGAPFWLVNGLADWKARIKDGQLVIMFHETWSSGAIWQRAYWQKFMQRRCIIDLLNIASKVVTSTRANADSLKVLGTDVAIEIIPIGSSFAVQPSQDKNWRHMVIFGKENARLRALKTHPQLLNQLMSKGMLDRIVLAGQCRDPLVDPTFQLLQAQLGPRVAKLKLSTCYNFDFNTVPAAVRECGLALMHTQSTHLLKSTSFQLAAQLGQVAIAKNERPADPPFAPGLSYLSYENVEIPNLLVTLQNQNQLAAVSSECARAASVYLSWPTIAKQWVSFLTSSDAR